MVTIAMIALIAGILLLLVSVKSTGTDKNMRNGSIIIIIGGIIGGCFATPSRDMPNGMPGAAALSIIFILIGIFLIVKKYIPTKNETEENKAKPNSKILLIVVAVIFLVLIVFAFASSSNTSNSNKPWKDLGVSEKEYMDVYNYYKYGTPIK